MHAAFARRSNMATKSDAEAYLDLEDEFPAKGSAEDKFRFLLRYTDSWPSFRGTRPWKFVVEGDAVNLYLDRSRARRPTDPDVRELTISCGAALQHLHVAARQFGIKLNISTFPSDDSNLLATITLGGRQSVSEMDTIIFYALHKWQGERRPLRAEKKVPADLLSEIQTMADTDKTWVHLARDEKEKSELASLVVIGALAEQESLKQAKKVPASVTARKRSSDTVGLAGGFDAVARYVLSFLPKVSEDAQAARCKKKLAGSAPVLVVLGTNENDREDWIAAGRMLATVLLRSLAIGIRASLVNQPVRNPELNKLLCSVLGQSGYPQVMFRLGYPSVAGTSAKAEFACTTCEELL